MEATRLIWEFTTSIVALTSRSENRLICHYVIPVLRSYVHVVLQPSTSPFSVACLYGVRPAAPQACKFLSDLLLLTCSPAKAPSQPLMFTIAPGPLWVYVVAFISTCIQPFPSVKSKPCASCRRDVSRTLFVVKTNWMYAYVGVRRPLQIDSCVRSTFSSCLYKRQ